MKEEKGEGERKREKEVVGKGSGKRKKEHLKCDKIVALPKKLRETRK